VYCNKTAEARLHCFHWKVMGGHSFALILHGKFDDNILMDLCKYFLLLACPYFHWHLAWFSVMITKAIVTINVKLLVMIFASPFIALSIALNRSQLHGSIDKLMLHLHSCRRILQPFMRFYSHGEWFPRRLKQRRHILEISHTPTNGILRPMRPVQQEWSDL